MLIKAIQLYLDDKKLDYRNANVMLMSTKQESTSIWADSDDEGENTPAGKLKRFKVARKPPKNRWQLISDSGTPKVELMVTEHEEDKGEKAEKTQLKYYYRFRSRQKGAIDALIDKTYAWYIAELKKQEDNSRYLYEMQLNPSSKSGDDDGAASRVFKRYKLSDEKQFSSSSSTRRRSCSGAQALRQPHRQVRGAGLPAQVRAAAARAAGHRQDVVDQGVGAAHAAARS